MIVWAVIALALCGVLHTRAEVVNNFIFCRQFFYKQSEPEGFDQNAHKICQQYGNSYYFASLYHSTHRIPLYSAYTFNYGCSKQEGRKNGNWFIEPQLSSSEDNNYAEQPSMKKYSTTEVANIKAKQAVNADYKFTGYDRGHLNPNSYQCGPGRDATFTLTNSAPMDACFNRVHWKEWEAKVRRILEVQDPAGTAYLVTGTVPSANNRIPEKGIFDDENEMAYNRVTVPTHIWTAVCYHHPDDEKSFSFGYIGKNKPHAIIKVNSLQHLTEELHQLYNNNNLTIFADPCSFPKRGKRKSEEVVKTLFRTVQLPIEKRLKMSSSVKNKLNIAMSLSDDEVTSTKVAKITNIEVDVFYKSKETWLTEMEGMKFASGYSCLLNTPFSMPVRVELRRKRETSPELVCTLKPEVLGDCSTSCLYIDQAKDYYCSNGYITIRCSPTYSDITVEGERCSSDHTCGHHGWDYYWCNTACSWDYCSPPLPLGKTSKGLYCNSKRNCAYYGSRNLWCDVGDSWDYCTR